MAATTPLAEALPSLEIHAVKELASLDQWVCWQYEYDDNGKPKKVPRQPSGACAKSNVPSTWSSFEACAQAVVSRGFDGMGFVFSPEDDYVGVDFDDILDDQGQIMDPSIAQWVADLGSYTEVSPSGEGLKVFAKGTIPSSVATKTVEMYETGRFFTVTGRVFEGPPETIAWGDEILPQLHAAVSKRKKTERKKIAEGEPILEGGRHDALKERSIQLRSKGLSREEARAALHAFNQTRCEPPESDSEVDRLAEWTGDHIESPQEEKPQVRSWPFFLGGDADGSVEHAYAVDDLFFEETINMIYGQQGALKTQLILDLAAYVGLGSEFMGRRTNQGATIYIAAEGSGAIAKRIAGVYLEHPALPHDTIVAVPRPVNLLNEEEVAAFATFAAEEIVPKLSMPVRMLSYDTMAKSMPGESDVGDDTISALEAGARTITRAIASANADRFVPATIFAHHPKKNENQFKGSYAIAGNFDTIIAIDRTDEPTLEDRLYEVTLDKLKDGDQSQSWAFQAALVEVGTTPSGKVNRAPVVRYLDAETRASIKAESKMRGKAMPKTVRHMIELILRIEQRDGREFVPTPFLEASGYCAAVEENGWDPDAEVRGIQLRKLQEMFYATESDADGDGTIPDALRKKWERRRDGLNKSTEAWIYEGWVWLAPDAKRTGVDGE